MVLPSATECCYVLGGRLPAPSKRPSPPARMVALLTEEKRRLIAANGHVTRQDFEAAWERSWQTMVIERGWPHLTRERRIWRQAQDGTKAECRAAFLDLPTPFAFAAGRLREAAAGMCLDLPPEQLGRALLAAMAYVEAPEERAAKAADAAGVFVDLDASDFAAA